MVVVVVVVGLSFLNMSLVYVYTRILHKNDLFPGDLSFDNMSQDDDVNNFKRVLEFVRKEWFGIVAIFTIVFVLPAVTVFGLPWTLMRLCEGDPSMRRDNYTPLVFCNNMMEATKPDFQVLRQIVGMAIIWAYIWYWCCLLWVRCFLDLWPLMICMSAGGVVFVALAPPPGSGNVEEKKKNE